MAAAKSNLRAALLALAAFALYATHDVVIKYLGALYSPFQILFYSVLLGFPMVTIMLMGDRTDGNLRPKHPWWTALRTVMVVVTGTSAFFAFTLLPLAQTYAILFAMPLLITLLAIPLLGERVGPRRGVAVAVGLAGVLIVLRPGSGDLGLGHLAALIAALSGAVAAVIIRKIGDAERSAVLLLYPMVANFIAMACVMPLVYRPMPVEHLGLLGVMAALGFAATALVIMAYRAGQAVIVAPMQYSQILWATLFGTLFFDERPDLWTAVGSAVIIASGIYIVLREDLPAVSANQPVLRGRVRAETGMLPRIGAYLARREGR